MILAIDPGTSKIGWAAVDDTGHAAGQGILPVPDWDGRLAESVDLRRVRVVVLGDGTNRVNIEQVLKRLLPQAALVAVDEKGSTVEAWRLKREEKAGRNPLKQLWFTLVQMYSPRPVDDYAARVLAQRYLHSQERGPE